MRRIIRFSLVLACVLVACPGQSFAGSIFIDFESFSESDVVGTVSGATFLNATVITAGSTLNEVDFPPHSGTNVGFDNGGPIRIDFTVPVSSFSGHFTYASPLTLRAFTGGNNLLGTTTSLFSTNTGTGGAVGSTPNELLALAFADIAYVTLTGDPSGGSFVLDDVTFTTPDVTPTPVPEPSTISLLLLGAAGLVRRRRGAVR